MTALSDEQGVVLTVLLDRERRAEGAATVEEITAGTA